MIGEMMVFGLLIAAIQLIAKPRIRKFKIKQGVAISKKRKAIKKRALRRLRKLKLKRIRTNKKLVQMQKSNQKDDDSSRGSTSISYRDYSADTSQMGSAERSSQMNTIKSEELRNKTDKNASAGISIKIDIVTPEYGWLCNEIKSNKSKYMGVCMSQ
ncbi:unnamed protein product [Anisakis simplex]|uniref:Uncharacterized protein n=1 Tax=Anisakis simplex TaxID=6269 RepID=A0A3P6T6Z1_ANISI|nr:unnamed protein product [Anisakis simplex]